MFKKVEKSMGMLRRDREDIKTEKNKNTRDEKYSVCYTLGEINNRLNTAE